MKKVYESPEIAVEFFELTQAIATCTLKIGLYDKDCIINDSDATSEMKSLALAGCWGSCEYPPEGMESNDGVCYHTNVNIAWNS